MATRKAKRYFEGDYIEDDAVLTEEQNAKNAQDAGAIDMERARDKAAAGPANFKEAFAAARGAGDKTFEYNGKKYTTDVAKPAAKTTTTATKTETKTTPKYESSYDRSRREDREAGRDFDSMVTKLKERITSSGSRGKALPLKSTKSESGYTGMGSTKFAKGGMTASSRGDGIAQRGKTRGTLIMCGGGKVKK